MNAELANEMSLTYILFTMCLKRGKESYQRDKEARYAALRRSSDEEDEI